MILLALLIVPTLFGILTLFIRGEEKRIIRRRILISGALLHTAGTAALFHPSVSHSFNRYLEVDALGLLFLSITSFLFLLISIYSFGYFYKETHPVSVQKGVRHLFSPCMLFFLSATTLTSLTSHLGLLWVSIEATTLASAPLIYYHHHEKALEATWKYLLICSVGIALALLGIFFIGAAGKGSGVDLFPSSFIRMASLLDQRLLRIGFILVLVGFGTKMGLAPLHAWLPDAHSEAPSPVSALLSGVLLNAAFLGILRCYQICLAAGLGPFAQNLLILLGLTSLFVAAVFITSQRDYKRLLAYSSVEHMGILSLGVGVGSGFGSLLHVINHSLVKGLLFLAAGQIVLAYRSKKIAEVQGLLKTVPMTGFLFAVGGLAVVGFPPFAPFISEFLILRDGFNSGHFVAMPLYLFFLSVIFVSLSKILFGMLQGEKRELADSQSGRVWMMMFSPFLLAFIIFLFGFYLPPPLVSFLQTAAGLLGGGRG